MDHWRHAATQASRWKRICAVGVAICLILTIVVCSLSVFSIRQGIFAPPWFDQPLGALRMVGYSTWNADCPPYTGCAPTRREAYVVWLMTDGWRPISLNKHAYRLLSLPIIHDP